MKKIMVLGASILQLPAILKAKEKGLEVVVVDMNPDAVGFGISGVIKEVISTIDIPAVLECAKAHKIDGIMTLASDMPMRTVAAVAKELKIVGISDDTALKATNKAVMREALFSAGVPVPEFYKVKNEKEYKDIVKKFTVPFIVKPADNSGSRGIFLVDDIYDESKVNEAYNYSHPFSRSGDVVVEEYMDGPEVSVETLSIDGVCHVIQITDKLTTGAPNFVEMGHNQPSMLSDDMKRKIAEVAKLAVKAIGIENGPSHTEIKVTSEGPKVVELGARLGGDNITTHLVPLSTGVDMVECTISIALGEKPDLTEKVKMSSAIRYLKPEIGKIVSISGIEQAEKLDGVKQISIVHGIGDYSSEIHSSTDRVGFVIAEAQTPEKAIEICEYAIKKINVKVEK